MKHDDLRSVAHNAAASIAGGVSFLAGFYELDVYGEAAASPNGAMEINFLEGTIQPAGSDQLIRAAATFPAVLSDLCKKHGVDLTDFREMKARYWATLQGGRFTVSITDRLGKKTERDYGGYNGRRVIVMDEAGRRGPAAIRLVNDGS